VDFCYEGVAAALFADLTLHLEPGWTGVVGANGAGKSTLLLLAAGRLRPTRGVVRLQGLPVYCDQRTDEPPTPLDDLLSDWSRHAVRWRARLEVQPDYRERWSTLSHGERKRAQLAVALWRQPDLLAVDEPTNHLDEHARQVVGEALAAFRGVGLLVSHDRDLLDRLCTQCLFLGDGAPVLRPGPWSQGAAQAERERAAEAHARAQATRRLVRLKHEARSRRTEADQTASRRSRRGLAKKDSDARERIGRAIVTGKDTRAGRVAVRMDRRVARERLALSAMPIHKVRRTGIDLAGAVSPRNLVVDAPEVRLPLGPRRQMELPALRIRPQARIAVTGPNGVGKSTLLRHLLRHARVEPERLLYVPQQIPVTEATRIMADVEGLDPDRRGALFTVVSRLGSDPKRLLANRDPSPGEVRKVILGLGLARLAQLLVLDEPTNHFDLRAIRALEEALAGFPGAIVLVSHDPRFREALCNEVWGLREEGEVVRVSR
jgi:ATPase subunit of ABC transporter with duplicated ATPase domains